MLSQRRRFGPPPGLVATVAPRWTLQATATSLSCDATRNRPGTRGRAGAVEIKPWLFRIARSACVDELRRRQLVRWEPLDGGRGTDNGDTPTGPAALLSSDSHDPEREVLRSERADLVRRALDRLPS